MAKKAKRTKKGKKGGAISGGALAGALRALIKGKSQIKVRKTKNTKSKKGGALKGKSAYQKHMSKYLKSHLRKGMTATQRQHVFQRGAMEWSK